MNLYRQQKLLEKLLKFRFKKHGFDLIKVEVYDRFDGDTYKCRLEIFKDGKTIQHRILKHEGKLTESFVMEAENRLSILLAEK
jgi:hypothetical protein